METQIESASLPEPTESLAAVGDRLARWCRDAGLDLLFPAACAGLRCRNRDGVRFAVLCRSASGGSSCSAGRPVCGAARPCPVRSSRERCHLCRGTKLWFDETVALGRVRRAAARLAASDEGRSRRIAVARARGIDLAAAAGIDWRRCGRTSSFRCPCTGGGGSARGTNSPALLAERLARRLRAPLATDLLRRTRHTPPQFSLPPSERPANVRGAFRGAGRLSFGQRPRVVGRRHFHDRLHLQCGRADTQAGWGGPCRRGRRRANHPPLGMSMPVVIRNNERSDSARARASSPAGRPIGWPRGCGSLGTRSRSSKSRRRGDVEQMGPVADIGCAGRVYQGDSAGGAGGRSRRRRPQSQGFADRRDRRPGAGRGAAARKSGRRAGRAERRRRSTRLPACSPRRHRQPPPAGATATRARRTCGSKTFAATSTRDVRKLDDGQFDAIVLAEAGLKRLGLADRISQVLPWEVMLPAVGQGALGIECRRDDARRSRGTRTRWMMRQRTPPCWPNGRCWRISAAAAWHRSARSDSIANGRLQSVGRRAQSRRLAPTCDASDAASPSDAIALGRRVADALLGTRRRRTDRRRSRIMNAELRRLFRPRTRNGAGRAAAAGSRPDRQDAARGRGLSVARGDAADARPAPVASCADCTPASR